MFDQLYQRPHVRARHRAGPLLKERLRFLAHLARRGIPRDILRKTASVLLVVAARLRLAARSREIITRDEIKRKATDSRGRFLSYASRWLGFLGRLERRISVNPFAKKIKSFADYMKNERDLSPETIRNRCWLARRFLHRLRARGGRLHTIMLSDIDDALQRMIGEEGYARVTIQTWAGELRAFFRYAETRGWCRKGLADGIQGPRIFAHASLPVGPSWDDVRRLLAMTEGDRKVDVRDRAILMLLAIYGLRAGEVNRLCLEDLDWDHELLTVAPSKTQRMRTYPLVRPVGDAILRYLKEARPRSVHREVFLSLHYPFKPLRQALWSVVGKRLRTLDTSLPHHGPHALRHACAARLLSQGHSLKEIGDQLGHSDPEATRIYAKVDLVGLRQVADFNLGELV
jgi:integrase/recombinase XerD